MFKCSHYLFKTRIKVTEAAPDNPLSINIQLFVLISTRGTEGQRARWAAYFIIGAGAHAACCWPFSGCVSAVPVTVSKSLERGEGGMNIQGKLRLITKGPGKAF